MSPSSHNPGDMLPCITFGCETHRNSGFVEHCSQAKACGHPQHHLAALHALWQESPECEQVMCQQHCLLRSSSVRRATPSCRATAATLGGPILSKTPLTAATAAQVDTCLGTHSCACCNRWERLAMSCCSS